MKRRSVVEAIGITSLPTAGCLQSIRGATKQIVWIRLANDRPEPHPVEVVIERGDEEVFTDDYHLGTESKSSTIRIEDPIGESGRYVIRFRADSQWINIEPSEYGDANGACLGVQFTLHRQGTTGYDIHPNQTC